MPLYQTHHIGPIESTYSVSNTVSARPRRTAHRRNFNQVNPVGGLTAIVVSEMGGAMHMSPSYRANYAATSVQMTSPQDCSIPANFQPVCNDGRPP